MYDVAIIGGGLVGTAIARELGKYDLSVCLVEKEIDLGMGSSRIMSGIVYSGCEFIPGSLKSRLCIQGNCLFESFCQELDVAFDQKGMLYVAYTVQQEQRLKDYAKWAAVNGVNVEWVSVEDFKKMEPGLHLCPAKALFVPAAGAVAAYQLPFAMAENAAANGVFIKRNSEVVNVTYNEHFIITTNNEILQAKHLINAAGTEAPKINNMVGVEEVSMEEGYVQYLLIDRLPDPGKILSIERDRADEKLRIFPTVDGYIMAGLWQMTNGSSLCYTRETTHEVLSYLIEFCQQMIPDMTNDIILSAFAGRYAVTPNSGDFMIKSSSNIPSFIQIRGIDDAGLTALPAISKEVALLLQTAGLTLKEKACYQVKRQNIKKSFIDINERMAEGEAVIASAAQLLHLANGEQDEVIEEPDGVTSSTFGGGPSDLWERLQMIKADPAYGRIICQCEQVTESEVIQSIHRPVGAKSVDGIRKRTRAGMGKCQGGFCTPHLVRLLAQEMDMPLSEVTKCGENSFMLNGENKESFKDREDAKHEKPL